MDVVNNISVKSKEDCCGCALCANICTKAAITMQSDSLGFKYPYVDITKCTNCGLCLKKCSFAHPKSDEKFKQRYYALRHKDEGELIRSQSGAAFVILSDVVLEVGGVVYGAAFDERFNVVHMRATNFGERELLRYSKYTQSSIEKCFCKIKEDLTNGLVVLFSGTPCQTAAVREAIPLHLCTNLYLVDIICHGVPSPNVWSDYLRYIEKKYGKIRKAYFRDKRLGWNVQKETFFCNREHSFITYKKLFHSNICLRDSCYNCQFTNFNRSSDITIGDFWGWEKVSTEFKDNKGVSLCIINTDKGNVLFNRAQKEHFVLRVKKENCIQPQLVEPSRYNPNRSKFEDDYNKHGFLFIAKKYSDLNLKAQLRYRLSKLLQVLKGK